MLSSKRNILLICTLSILWNVVSCATKKIVSIPPKQIPPLDAKIYAAPGIDWSQLSKFTLDLQEIGTPEESRNQILEKYLLDQVVQCLERKGYHYRENNSDIRIRLYFKVEEDKVNETVLAYSTTTSYSSNWFLTQYNLASGLLRTATLASTEWRVRNEKETIFEGEISVEVFDKEGKMQLWRGDVRAPLANDDIRVASNWMIRELLWNFPALDYPPVNVPEVNFEEADAFWNSSISDREFYSPGQRYPVSFKLTSLRDTSMISLNEAKIAFRKTKTYELVKQKIPGYEKVEASRSYKRAFQKYLNDVVEEYNIQMQKMIIFKKRFREFAAINDLLLTAPWSLKREDGTILFAGRYFIGEDNAPTFVSIEADPQVTKILSTALGEYKYQKYYISRINIFSKSDYEKYWERSRSHREMALGSIDFLPELPTPAIKIPGG